MNPKILGGLVGAGIGAVVGSGLAWLVIEMFFSDDEEEEELIYLEESEERQETPDERNIHFTKTSYEDGKPEISDVVDYTRYSKIARPYGSASFAPKMLKNEALEIPTELLGKKASDLLAAGIPEDTVKAVFGTSFVDDVIEIDTGKKPISATVITEEEETEEEVIHQNIFDHEDTKIIDENVPEDHEIILISMDTYLNGNATHEKYSCTYFFEDDILAGVDNELDKMDPRWTVGQEAIDLLKYEDLSTVCASNLTLKHDYEICISSGSYTDALEELKWADSQ